MPPRKDWTKITYIPFDRLPLITTTWPPWAVVCPLPFEVVDAAVARHLPEPSIDVVITRIVHTAASVCYALAHDRDGDQGKVWVRAVGPAQTELVVEAPPYPPRRVWTPEETAYVDAQLDTMDMIRAVETVDDRIDDECDALYRDILWPHSRSIMRFASRFVQDRERVARLLAAAPGHHPPSTPVAPPASEPAEAPPRGPHEKPGHPGLEREELVYRLAKALEAEEMKERHPARTWKEISYAVRFGRGESKGSEIALLRDARLRLQRLRESALETDRQLLADVIERKKTMSKTR